MGMPSMGNPGVPMPPPAAHPATMGSAQLALTGLEARQRASAQEGKGFDNTLQTGPEGVKSENTTKATLLGQ